MSKQITAALAMLAAANALVQAAFAEGGAGEGAADGAAAGKTTAAKTTAAKTTGSKTAAKTEGPKTSRADLNAALTEVKEQKGASVAKGLIKSVGKSDKLGEVEDQYVDALFAAAKKELGDEAGDDDAGDDL